MLIGVPREIKAEEYRVGLTPESVAALTGRGHEVLVETGAGAGIGADDAAYRAAGASIAEDAAGLYGAAELVVKVKEPLPPEYGLLREGQVLFTYLHLAADPEQAEALTASGVTAIAYETVEDRSGGLPLLAPMSEIAGRMAVQAGAHFLERPAGGRGVLLAGAPGVERGRVVILGGGTVGSNAARIALGLNAEVTIVQRSAGRMRVLEEMFDGRVRTAPSQPAVIRALIAEADLVVGAVLVAGGRAPILIGREDLGLMKAGAVIADVAIDQGGCCETSRPTSHAEPVYTVDGIVHYCVANMPGAVPWTSAQALNLATLPYVMALAEKGVDGALAEDDGFAKGLTVRDGAVVNPVVAEALKAA